MLPLDLYAVVNTTAVRIIAGLLRTARPTGYTNWLVGLLSLHARIHTSLVQRAKVPLAPARKRLEVGEAVHALVRNAVRTCAPPMHAQGQSRQRRCAHMEAITLVIARMHTGTFAYTKIYV